MNENYFTKFLSFFITNDSFFLSNYHRSMTFSELQFSAKYPISHTTGWQIFLMFFRLTFTYCLMCVPVSGPSYELHSASNIITNSGRLWDPNWKTSLAVLKLKLTQLQKSASNNLNTHNKIWNLVEYVKNKTKMFTY